MNAATASDLERLLAAFDEFESEVKADFEKGRTVVRKLETRTKRGRLSQVITEHREEHLGSESAASSSSK